MLKALLIDSTKLIDLIFKSFFIFFKMIKIG